MNSPTHLDIFLDAVTLRAGYSTEVVVLAMTLFGVAAGILGVFAMLRRNSLLCDTLGHATLPGVAAAYLVGVAIGGLERNLLLMLSGAAVAAGLSVLTVSAIVRTARIRNDAAVAIALSVFFGLGSVLLGIIQWYAPGSSAGLHHLILGQAATMVADDAAMMAGLVVVTIIAALLFTKEFTLVSFDEHFASVSGWPVRGIDLLAMSLTTLLVVVGLHAVGLVLVVALLILPAVTARLWSNRVATILILAAGFGAGTGYVGAALSATFPDAPTGAVTVLVGGAWFIVSLLFSPHAGLLIVALRQVRYSLRIAHEHLIEGLYVYGASGQMSGRLASRAELQAIAHERGWSSFQLMIVLAWSELQGNVVRVGSALSLTERGVALGARVRRNHLLWAEYLLQSSGNQRTEDDWSIDQVEHVLSDQLIADLESALRQRGVPIPERFPRTEVKND